MQPHTELLLSIVKGSEYMSYLELGIEKAFNIYAMTGVCQRVVGVDVNDIRDAYNFEFYHGSTDAFFMECHDKFDFIFIDANHDFEYVKKDFINSLKVLKEGGTIALHDTDPKEMQYVTPEACGNAYEVVGWIKVNYPCLNVITLPIDIAGVTLVNKDKERRINNFLQ